jgi:hypothetical protein
MSDVDHLFRLVKRNLELRAFVLSLLDPEAFGFAVTAEVRDAAKRVLNLPVAGDKVPLVLKENSQ